MPGVERDQRQVLDGVAIVGVDPPSQDTMAGRTCRLHTAPVHATRAHATGALGTLGDGVADPPGAWLVRSEVRRVRCLPPRPSPGRLHDPHRTARPDAPPRRPSRTPRVLHETLQATRAFPGCLGVEVLRGADDASRIMVAERWESADSDAAYRAWRATPAGASHLGSLLAGAPSLTTFTAEPEI